MLCSGSAWAQNLNIRESFEGTPAEHGYTSNTFIAGTLRYFFRASDPVTVSGTQTFGSGGVGVMASEDGSFFWACEAVRSTTSNTAPTAGFDPGVVTLNGIPNSENYTNIRVTVAVGEPRNSTNIARQSDHLRVQYCYGSATGPFNTVGEFTGTVPGGTSPWTRIGAGSTGPTTILGSTFTDHTFPIPAGSGLLYVRIEADYNGGQKEIAFDNIRVTGTASAVVKPTLTSNVGTSTLTFAEGTATPLTVFSDLTVGNPAMASNPTLTGATVTLSPYAGVEDNVTYTIPAGNGITLSSNTNGVLTFAGASGVGNYELLLESIKYKNTEVNNATAGDRTFTFVVRDGATESIPLSRIITVTTAINGTSLLPRFETFDSDGEGTRYASNTKTVTLSGTTFGFLRLMGVVGGSASPGSTYGSSNTFTNLQGTGYWFVNGTKNIVAGNIGYVKLAPVNTTGFVNLHFKVKAGAGAGVFASTDFLRFAHSLDGGQTWTVFANYFGSDNAGQGQLRLNGVATNPQLSTTATDLDFALPAAVAGTAVEFRVEVYVDADEIVFDNIQITGTQQPTVTTGTAGSITGTTASISNNSLTADGGATITDYGVVYVAGAGTPTTANSKAQSGTSSPGSFPASFSVNLSGLAPGTQYTARAYATNSVGTAYGSSVSYTTTPNAPVVTAPANNSPVNTTTPTYSGTAVAGSTVTVYVDGTAIGTTTATVGTFSLNQPTALSQGSHTVFARADINGSAQSSNSSTITFTVDTVRPTVAITSATAANGGSTSISPIAYTVTFSENVNGSFVQGDLNVAGGSISGFTTVVPGTTFTVNLTPTGNGAVVVNVPANVAQDAAANFNTAASPYTITYLATPTITGFATEPALVCGSSPLSFTATVGNLSPPYAFTLSNGSSTTLGSAASTAFSQGLTASGSGMQTFTLTVSSQGQVATATTSVTVNASPPASLVSSGTLSCAQTSLTLTAGGGSAYTFSAGAAQIGSTSQAVVTTAGLYSVTVTAATGCTATASTSLSLTNTLVASAGASSSTASVGGVVSLSASGGSTYQWLAPPGTLLSSPATSSLVSATLTASGPQTFTVIVSQGACSQTLTVGVTGVVLSDLTPILYARPGLLYGPSSVTVVVDVVELNGVASSGTLTVRLTKDSKVSLSFPPSATSVGGRAVQNSVWSLSSDPNYYVLTTSQPVGAGDKLSLGLTGVLSPGATTGMLSISAILLTTGMDEARTSNNADADKIEYFQQ